MFIPERRWVLSSSSDRRALDVVDGAGQFTGMGAHYSRRTPGSKTFTGVGREIVLVTRCGRAVWACVYQRTPSAKGSGASRGRAGIADAKPRHIWRNMLFRNLGAGLSSDLIAEAVEVTYLEWTMRYGSLPPERLRTEIRVDAVASRNPGYCYLRAGWEPGETRRGIKFLWAPLARTAGAPVEAKPPADGQLHSVRAELDATAWRLEIAVGLVRRLFATTKHFTDCVCVTCEDVRAFLAPAPPVPPKETT